MPFPNQLLQPIRRGRMLKSVTRYSRQQSVLVILSKLSGTSVFIGRGIAKGSGGRVVQAVSIHGYGIDGRTEQGEN